MIKLNYELPLLSLFFFFLVIIYLFLLKCPNTLCKSGAIIVKGIYVSSDPI